MSTDPLTMAVAQALNDRFDGIPGTVELIAGMLEPARGDTGMDEIYRALDVLEQRWRSEHGCDACDGSGTIIVEHRRCRLHGDISPCTSCPQCGNALLVEDVLPDKSHDCGACAGTGLQAPHTGGRQEG